MECSLPRAEPPAAVLEHEAEVTGAPRGSADVHPHEATDLGPPVSAGAPVQRAGIVLLGAGLAVAQLAWVTLLAYGVYWLAARLPL